MKYNKTWTITEYLLNNPGKRIKVTYVAKELKVSKASVSLTVKELAEDGIVKGLYIDMKSPRTRAFKIMINVNSIVKNGVIEALKKYALGIGLYGSWVKGTNTEDSDIDIWIKPKYMLKQSGTAILSKEIRERLGVDAEVLILSKVINSASAALLVSSCSIQFAQGCTGVALSGFAFVGTRY